MVSYFSYGWGLSVNNNFMHNINYCTRTDKNCL
jgi:hypothetical protein